MTTFSTTDIPSDVNTLEQLAMWCMAGLELNSGNDTYPETLAGPEFVVSIKKGRAYDGTLRRICRVSFQLTPDYQTRPMWKAVEELKAGVIPDSFKLAEPT